MVFIEQKEMARDAFKGKAAAVKTGYRKQQTTVSQSDEVKLRKKVKCKSCDAQINQFALARSGKLCEHKLCKQCWKSAKQKRESKNPKAAAAQEEKVKPDEASTLFVSSNLALSCQGIAGGKVRNKVKKVKVHMRIDNFVNG